MNNYFLNLNKFKQKQKLVSEISNNNKLYTGNTEVPQGVKSFYQDLYRGRSNSSQDEDNTLFENSPKLTKERAEEQDRQITKEELLNALKTCKESAPGPDRIPYLAYKKL